jgi:heme-degrading monooxygenase HmoA
LISEVHLRIIFHADSVNHYPQSAFIIHIKFRAEVNMAIKVFIKRYVKKGKTEDTLALLNEVRSQALKQPGYISGETLVNHYDASHVTVVSTWQTIEDWIRWQESDERAMQEDQLESLQKEPAKFEIYDFGPAARD